ncbi:hypothetical protein [Methanogenium cariaci]|uniref:hypothetical protein n=1 Tax=Methanogenium cariaci TaxID=2197 RepID=UPI0012F7035B|nr:hypothetical protein [Methanogenium cariaci]
MELVALGPDAGRPGCTGRLPPSVSPPEAVEAGGVSCTTPPDGREWRVTITSAENSNRPVKSSPPADTGSDKRTPCPRRGRMRHGQLRHRLRSNGPSRPCR